MTAFRKPPSLAVVILCQRLGLHEVVRSTSGLDAYCAREGCDWYYSYG